MYQAIGFVLLEKTMLILYKRNFHVFQYDKQNKNYRRILRILEIQDFESSRWNNIVDSFGLTTTYNINII